MAVAVGLLVDAVGVVAGLHREIDHRRTTVAGELYGERLIVVGLARAAGADGEVLRHPMRRRHAGAGTPTLDDFARQECAEPVRPFLRGQPGARGGLGAEGLGLHRRDPTIGRELVVGRADALEEVVVAAMGAAQALAGLEPVHRHLCPEQAQQRPARLLVLRVAGQLHQLDGAVHVDAGVGRAVVFRDPVRARVGQELLEVGAALCRQLLVAEVLPEQDQVAGLHQEDVRIVWADALQQAALGGVRQERLEGGGVGGVELVPVGESEHQEVLADELHGVLILHLRLAAVPAEVAEVRVLFP